MGIKQYWELRTKELRAEADKLKVERNEATDPQVIKDIRSRLEHALQEWNVASEAVSKF